MQCFLSSPLFSLLPPSRLLKEGEVCIFYLPSPPLPPSSLSSPLSLLSSCLLSIPLFFISVLRFLTLIYSRFSLRFLESHFIFLISWRSHTSLCFQPFVPRVPPSWRRLLLLLNLAAPSSSALTHLTLSAPSSPSSLVLPHKGTCHYHLSVNGAKNRGREGREEILRKRRSKRGKRIGRNFPAFMVIFLSLSY